MTTPVQHAPARKQPASTQAQDNTFSDEGARPTSSQFYDTAWCSGNDNSQHDGGINPDDDPLT
jgi:hypothetical protein